MLRLAAHLRTLEKLRLVQFYYSSFNHLDNEDFKWLEDRVFRYSRRASSSESDANRAAARTMRLGLFGALDR